MIRRMAKQLARERGQILVLGAFLVTALVGLVGLVVDGGFYYAQRRQAQSTADAAATAAAYALYNGATKTQAQTTGEEYALANGFGDGASESVTVNMPPTSGPHAGDDLYVEVTIREQPNTFFIHVLLPGGSGIAGRGVARYPAPNDLYALFASDNTCNNPTALTVSGSDALIDGAVHSNSDMKVSGSNNDFDGQVTYGCSLQVGGSGNAFDPAPAPGPDLPLPIDYDYGDFPCTVTFSGNVNLNNEASVWVGDDPNSNQLNSGVYCSTGGITLTGSNIVGTVTLVARGDINISGSNFTLRPYWNHVLLFSEDSYPKGIDMSASGGDWEGLMLAPNGLAKITGSGNASIAGSVMAGQIQVAGGDFSLTALDYGQGVGGVRLVE